MRKPSMVAVQSMSHLHQTETNEIYNPLEEMILQWFKEHYIPKIDVAYYEPMTDIVKETLARFRMIGTAALRRHVLSTSCLETMPDIETVQYAIIRELDIQLGSFMDDMSCAVDGTPMDSDDDRTRYEEMIYDAVDHIFETARETLMSSIKDEMVRWHELLTAVHSDLYWTAENLGIVAYLSDFDNVIFSGEDVEDAIVVYGVLDLPEVLTSITYKDEKDFQQYRDVYFDSPWWTDQYIITVNDAPAHPDHTALKEGDVIKLYEVEACKS